MRPSTASPERRRVDWVLGVAGLLTSAMALYHFWLPSAFGWSEAMIGAPALRWGLFMLNASFSYLLLAGGLLTLVIAGRGAAAGGIARLVLMAIGGYWLFNSLYQIVSPLPLPRALAGLRWAFLGFSLSLTCLYGAALAPRGAPRADLPRPEPGAP
jgi:hypothetical protein